MAGTGHHPKQNHLPLICENHVNKVDNVPKKNMLRISHLRRHYEKPDFCNLALHKSSTTRKALTL